MRNYRRTWVIAVSVIALAVLLPVYWIALHAPAVGMFHDDGVYLVTAKALATGHGYRIISLPDEIPQTKYPPLFPLVLSMVWRLAPSFPANVLALKLVPLAFALLWFGLTWRLVGMEASAKAAAVVVVLTAVTRWALYLSTGLLSETMFAAICTASLISLRRIELRRAGNYEWIVAAILAGLACLTRTAGIALIMAGGATLILRRRSGDAIRFVAVAGLVVAPWFLWVGTQYLPDTDAYYSAANYGSWNVLSHYFSLAQKITIVSVNALWVLRSPWRIQGIPWTGGFQMILSAAILVAAVRMLRVWTVIDVFLALYVAMMVAWAWPPDRLLVVVYPLVLLTGYRVLDAFLKKLPHRRLQAIFAAVVALTLVMAQSFRQIVFTADTARETGVVLDGQDAWRSTSEQLNWIRDRVPPDSVVLSNLDPLVFLYTNRKAIRGFQADPYGLFYDTGANHHPLGTVDQLIAAVRTQRVQYIVCARNGTFAEAPYLNALIREMMTREQSKVRMVAQGSDPEFQIYRVEQPI